MEKTGVKTKFAAYMCKIKRYGTLSNSYGTVQNLKQHFFAEGQQNPKTFDIFSSSNKIKFKFLSVNYRTIIRIFIFPWCTIQY